MTVFSKIYLCLPGLCFIVPGPQHACLCQRPDPRTLPFQRREVCCPPDAGCRTWLVHIWSEAHFNTSTNCSICLPSGSGLKDRCSSDRRLFAVIFSLLNFCNCLNWVLQLIWGISQACFELNLMTSCLKWPLIWRPSQLLFIWSLFDFIKSFQCVVAQLL